MTSAFLPFSVDPSSTTPTTPSLPSPPLSAFTQLPSLFEQRRRRGDWLFFDKTELELKPLLRGGSAGCCSLPPLQNVILSPPQPLLLPSLSPPSEEESWTGGTNSTAWLSPPTRKGSIASLLNADPERQPADSPESRPVASPPGNLKRGRPRVLTGDEYTKKRRTSRDTTPLPVRMASPPTMLSYDGEDQPTRTHKGLRQFSKRVCDKVAEKGVTTYNEVADELAMDIRATMDANSCNMRSLDQKNIRRRVYDALNVLMAMDIITKDKKQIKWLGIPNHLQQPAPVAEPPSPLWQERVAALRKMVDEEEGRQAHLLASVKHERTLISNKLGQHLQVCNLIWRNQQRARQNASSIPSPGAAPAVFLPFFTISCGKQDMTVDVASDSRSAVISHAPLDTPPERIIFEDADVLRYLRFNELTVHQLTSWLPDPRWQSYVKTQPIDNAGTLCVLSSSAMA